MSNILILPRSSVAAITATRGGASSGNLLTYSPKEVWVDTAVGTAVNISIDFGEVRSIDTVFLGFVNPAPAGATWRIQGGVAGYTELTLRTTIALRAVDSATRMPAMSHALWTGASASVRYLRLVLTQPADAAPMTAGIVMAGAAWRPTFNMEFGSGRRVIDTGTIAALQDGGFASVEGVRKRTFNWTLGDLTVAEVDALEELVMDHGETIPLLVVEDPDASVGQRGRIHYGVFSGLQSYGREDPTKTKWEFTFEEWL